MALRMDKFLPLLYKALLPLSAFDLASVLVRHVFAERAARREVSTSDLLLHGFQNGKPPDMGSPFLDLCIKITSCNKAGRMPFHPGPSFSDAASSLRALVLLIEGTRTWV